MKTKEQEILKDTISKVKLKTKTMAIISKEENLTKLRSLVESGSDRLVDLANQWNEVRSPLLDEYKSLQSTLTSEETKLQADEIKLYNLKETHKNILSDIKEKEELEKKFIEKLKHINRNSNRYSILKVVKFLIY